MYNYKICIGGIGAEVYIHHIYDEQIEKLKMIGIENQELEHDINNIINILEVDHIDQGEINFTGAYGSPELYVIDVFDENSKLVWKSDGNTCLNQGIEEGDCRPIESIDFLVCENKSEGSYFEFKLETENIFDPEKLETQTVDIGGNGTIVLLSGLKYDRKSISLYDYINNNNRYLGMNYYIF
jgi:hypothetical protein